MWKKLIKWSQEEFSELPWRKKRTLYRTLVSEIMLQQTTVATVINHFDKFIEKYPNFESLAQTSEEEMLVAWKGLGYYRRAKNLRLAAQEVVTRFNGKLPQKYDDLISIKGIGPYTASAIMGIGRNKPFLPIDANLERVLSRLYGIKLKKGPRLQKEITRRFENKEILNDKSLKRMAPRDLNEALMDLGRTYCQSRKASCELCYLSKSCMAYHSKKPLSYPLREAKKEVDKYNLELIRVVVEDDEKRILGMKRQKGQWLEGQYEVPTFILSSDDKNLKQYPTLKKISKKQLRGHQKFKSSITKYKISNIVIKMSWDEFKSFFQDSSLGQFDWLCKADQKNLSSASHKTIQSLAIN